MTDGWVEEEKREEGWKEENGRGQEQSKESVCCPEARVMLCQPHTHNYLMTKHSRGIHVPCLSQHITPSPRL